MKSGQRRDPLFNFELKVARCADKLSRDPSMRDKNPLEVWQEAERQTGNPFSQQIDSPAFRRRP
jgi:hypothetical protein